MLQRQKAKFIVLLLIYHVLVFNIISPVVHAEEYWPAEIEIISHAGIVMDMNSGVILYAKDEHGKYFPASITKILTTLIAIEQSDMDEIVTFSKDAVEKNEGDNSHISRDIGEQMTMEQTLYAVMLESANECAYAVAEHVGGNVETFVQMMNNRAAAIGCKESHFNNPNGLPDPNHYISAYDMALIAREAYKNEDFRRIASTRAYSIPPTNTHTDITYLNNHHQMINNYKTDAYIYDGCEGGKTGFTDDAGWTLVTYAKRDDMNLVCVVLNAPDDAYYTDTINLLNYCFDNFTTYPIAEQWSLFAGDDVDIGALAKSVEMVKVDEEATVILPKAVDFTSVKYDAVPKKKASDGVIGEVRFTYADRYVGKANLLYADTNTQGYPFSNTGEEADQTIRIDLLFLLVVGVVLVIAGFILVRLRNWSYNIITVTRRRHNEAKMMEFKGVTIKRNNGRRGNRRKR